MPELFHGSTEDIAQFHPCSGVHAGGAPYHGTLATHDRPMAMLYALKQKEAALKGAPKDARGIDPADFMWTNHSIKGVPCAIVRDRDKYLQEFKGGYLYHLPQDRFTPVTGPGGTATTEWLSTDAVVTPTRRETVSFEQALKEGCQVFFLKDGVDFNAIYNAHMQEFDAGPRQLALLQKLTKQGVLIHENAVRNLNPVNLFTGMLESEHPASGPAGGWAGGTHLTSRRSSLSK